jgi:hypothetical protein
MTSRMRARPLRPCGALVVPMMRWGAAPKRRALSLCRLIFVHRAWAPRGRLSNHFCKRSLTLPPNPAEQALSAARCGTDPAAWKVHGNSALEYYLATRDGDITRAEPLGVWRSRS